MQFPPTIRSLFRSPLFSALTIVTMGLGIAATTALFSVVDAVLLEPLAFPQPDRIVVLNTAWPAKAKVSPRVTGGDFLDLRAALHSFSDLSFYNGGELAVGVRLQGHARFAQTFQVDAAFFPAVHVQPSLGRLPEREDAGHTALVSAGFARANWGEASNALGQTLSVENRPYQVIGIVKEEWAFPEKAEVWITGPAAPENQNRSAFNNRAVGSLRAGVSLSQAQAELATVSARLAAAHPETNEDKVFRAVSLQEQLVAPVRMTLLFLFGAAGLLLLISCANVANLMLARATARAREIAIRASLGSSSIQMVSLLLGESVALGIAASLVGLFLAYAGIRAFFPLIPASVPHAADAIHVNAAVLLFAGVASCFTVMACSVIPALHLRKLDLAVVLNGASAGRCQAAQPARAISSSLRRSRFAAFYA